MNNNVVSIHELSFNYPGQKKPCFSNLNLDIIEGERFGIFGPNGAGKTTLINCIIGVLCFQKGSIRIFNNDIKKNKKEAKKIFGFVPQDFSFYHELSPIENFNFFGTCYGINKTELKNKISELLEVLNLTDVRHKPIKDFSGGMKRKINLAIGVLHNPKLLILDEPTVGVDVHSRQTIINYLKQMNLNGTTLIYTSHQLDEAEELCNKIALYDHGKILAIDNLNNLLQRYQANNLEDLFVSLTGEKNKNL